jgi:Zn-dependent M28 family amino/carboxypeptidase
MLKVVRLVAILSLLATGLVLAPAVDAGPKSCAKRVNDTAAKLMECVTLSGVRAHQQALQSIATANGGTRAAGTPGYTASVAYVVGKLQAAGYIVTLDEFPFLFTPPVVLEQLTPPPAATYESGSYTNSGFGEVTGAVIPVDINLTPPRASTSGCEAADFAGFDWSGANDIALIQRGTCTFGVKAENAETAGAEAVIIFNQGNTPLREGLIVGTLDPVVVSIPVVGASFAQGEALARPGSTAHILVDPPESRPQVNILAESPTGDPDNVIMAGAHLDSVQAGPGINDNGSGSAAILEVALQMKKVKPINKMRFAWWGAEESGLVGSEAYVAGLSEAERDQIELYLNFDMVGSPNYVFFVYDGDNSDGVGAPAGPPGSAEIEEVFEDFYMSRGEPFKGTDFSGRSDYGPFIATEVDIPSGGLFTGAEGVKTADEVVLWGGTADQQYDPCYHLACDTFANNSNHALDVNSDAVAYATVLYAMGVETLPEPLADGLRTTNRSSHAHDETLPRD